MLVFLAFAFADFFSFPLPLFLLQIKLDQSRVCKRYTLTSTGPFHVLYCSVSVTHAEVNRAEEELNTARPRQNNALSPWPNAPGTVQHNIQCSAKDMTILHMGQTVANI